MKGKIVLCDGLNPIGPFLAGAVGVVSSTDILNDTANVFPLPGSRVSSADGTGIYTYVQFTRYILSINLFRLSSSSKF